MEQEVAIPWDPIPHEFNRLSDVYVGRLAEIDHPVQSITAITVISPALGRPEEGHEWRLFFEPPFAYQLRPSNDWPEALPLTWPSYYWDDTGRRVALWEVVHSTYIAQSVHPSNRGQAHHYVLMSHDMAYEFVAETWRAEYRGVVS